MLYINLFLAGVIMGLLWPKKKGKKIKAGQDNRIKQDEKNKSINRRKSRYGKSK